MYQRLLSQYCHSFIVHYITIGIDQPVLPMTGIGVERNISDNAKLRKAFLQLAYYTGHKTHRIGGLGGSKIFQTGLDNGKNSNRGYAELQALFCSIH